MQPAPTLPARAPSRGSGEDGAGHSELRSEKFLSIERQQVTAVEGSLQGSRGRLDNWVSYNADARQSALSNYMFSTPSEWFAEAYTAYYNPNGRGRHQLTAAVRQWLAENLGEALTAGDKGRNQSSGTVATGKNLQTF